jgi:hypothetical protein
MRLFNLYASAVEEETIRWEVVALPLLLPHRETGSESSGLPLSSCTTPNENILMLANRMKLGKD